MKFARWWRRWGAAWKRLPLPFHLRRGREGEDAARRHLSERGLVFLTANYRTLRGEIDLIFRDGACLVFVEVKTRSTHAWHRPARAVDARKRRALSRVALEYLRELAEPRVPVRFDVVEVWMSDAGDGGVAAVRHLPNMFPLSAPYRHG